MEKVCKDVCETYTDQECKEVPVTTTEYYYETVCKMVDQKNCIWADCWPACEKNPDPDNCIHIPGLGYKCNCQDFPADECHDLETSKPVVAYETKCVNKIKTRTRKDCEDIHKKIPKEVSKKVAQKVCLW